MNPLEVFAEVTDSQWVVITAPWKHSDGGSYHCQVSPIRWPIGG